MNMLGGNNNQPQEEVYAGIQVTTSVLGQPIPFVAGRQRVPGTLIWYGGFSAQGHTQGGKGNNNSSETYTYSTSFILCVSLGPIVGINRIWNGKKLWDNGEAANLTSENLALSLGGAKFTGTVSGTTLTASNVIGYIEAGANLADIPGNVPNGTTIVTQLTGTAGGAGTYQISTSLTIGTAESMSSSQLAWGGYPSGTPAVQMLPYDHMGTLASSGYQLGGSAAMPQLTFEVEGCVPGFNDASGMYDADFTAVIPIYLQDPVIGAGFQGTIQNLQGTTNTVQAYCMSLGLTGSPYEYNQRAATDYVKECLQIMNCDGFVSVGQLKILPLGDQPVSNVTPDGTHWSWTPNLTPVFSFNDDDYCPKPGETPVKMTEKPLNQTHNMVDVQFNDRSNYYSSANPVNASLNNDIALTGPRLMTQLSFPQITNAQTALMAGQLILQVDRYEIHTYEFRVPQDFSQAEPNDYITITDSVMGLVNQDCRILEVEDDEDDMLVIRALEIPGVVRTTPQYNWGTAAGYFANYATSPGSVQAPVIFQMPQVALPNGAGPTIGIAVCGQTQNTNWKGCTVYCSFDGGNTYAPIGQVGPNGPARYGVLYGNIVAGAANPDVSHTLSVALANTTEQLSTAATYAQADAKQTLFLVDSGSNAELMSYGTGVLNSAGEYSLSYLWRGLYGSVNGTHLGCAFTGSISGTALTVSGATGTLAAGQIVQGANVLPGTKLVSGGGSSWVVNKSQTVSSEPMVAGVPFVRLDGSIYCMAIDPGYAGTTLYFKFCSFNTWGQANEALAAVPAYTYVAPAGPLLGAAQLLPRGNASLTPAGLLYKATNAGNAWDSDCVSTKPFGSCSVSAQVTVPANFNAIGLVSSTASTLQPGVNMDFALYNDSGSYVIYEGTTNIGSYGTPAAGDAVLVTYDGFYVRYFLNGTVLRASPIQQASLYIGFALYNQGSSWSNVQTGPFTAVTPTQWLTVGAAVVNDTTVGRTTNTGAWDSGSVSVTGYPTCHVAGKTNNVNTSAPLGRGMFGLCTAAHAAKILQGGTSLYPLLDYAWYSDENDWIIYEAGTSVAVESTVAALTDKAWITYDGTNVRYYLNNPSVAVRTVAVSGLTLFGASVLLDQAAGFNSLEFGPTTNLKVNDSAELGTSAATTVSVTTFTNVPVSVSGGAVLANAPIVGTYAFDTTIISTLVYVLSITAGSSASQSFTVPFSVGQVTGFNGHDTLNSVPASTTQYMGGTVEQTEDWPAGSSSTGGPNATIPSVSVLGAGTPTITASGYLKVELIKK